MREYYCRKCRTPFGFANEDTDPLPLCPKGHTTEFVKKISDKDAKHIAKQATAHPERLGDYQTPRQIAGRKRQVEE